MDLAEKAAPALRRALSQSDIETLALIDSPELSYLGPMIQVSGVCNLKCTMCGGAQDLVPGKFMSLELFKTICTKLKADNINGMIIAGAYGEPFLNPNIFEMLEYAKSLGFTIVLSTHGNNLDEAKIDRLAALDLFHIQFSYCGYDKETYERIYKGGKFEKVIANMRTLRTKLRERGDKTQFLANGVSDRNDPEMATKTIALLGTLGVPANEVRVVLPHNFAGTSSKFEGMENYDGVLSFKQVPKQHLSVCKVLAKVPGIMWDGRVSACGCLDYRGRLELGNINFSSLSEIRQSKPFKTMVEAFRNGDVSGIDMCNTCDIPFGDTDALDLLSNAKK